MSKPGNCIFSQSLQTERILSIGLISVKSVTKSWNTFITEEITSLLSSSIPVYTNYSTEACVFKETGESEIYKIAFSPL